MSRSSQARTDAQRRRVILSVVVPVERLRIGDFVDFGPEAVPPRIWCVGSIQTTLDGCEIHWEPALPGLVGRGWTGKYVTGRLLNRVPDVVVKVLRG